MWQLRTILLIGLTSAACVASSHRGPAQTELVIRNVVLIDGTAAPARGPVDVVVRDGRIFDIAAAGHRATSSTAAVVEGGGHYLIPGLWDAHVHLTAGDDSMLGVLVANGVTGIRDMGGDLAVLDTWRARVESGHLVGPRIFRAGPAVDGQKPGVPYHLAVAGAEAAREAVLQLKRLGVDFVKVHTAIPRDAYFALAGEAKRQRLPLVGHIPGAIEPAEALMAGQRSIEHIATFFESASFARRYEKPSQQVPAIEDWLAEDLPAIASLFAATEGWFTPTLVGYEVRARRGQLADDPDPRIPYVAPGMRRFWDLAFPITPNDHDPETAALRSRFVDLGLALTQRLYAAGVPIVVGSDLGGRDVIPGFSVHDEIALLIKAGLPPIAALQAATVQVADLLGLADHGSIRVGNVADLVLLDADPLADPRNLQRIVAVVCRGRYLDRADLDSLLARALVEGSSP